MGTVIFRVQKNDFLALVVATIEGFRWLFTFLTLIEKGIYFGPMIFLIAVATFPFHVTGCAFSTMGTKNPNGLKNPPEREAFTIYISRF